MRTWLVSSVVLLLGASDASAEFLHCLPTGEWTDACFVERLAANKRATIALEEATDRRLTFSLSTIARRNAADDADYLDRLKGLARRIGMTCWTITEPASAGGIPLAEIARADDPDPLFIDATLALRSEAIALTSEAMRRSHDPAVVEEARRQRDDAARDIGVIASRNFEIPDIDLSGKRRIWRGWD